MPLALKSDRRRRVYRSRTQSVVIVAFLLTFDVIVGAGVARNEHRTSLVIFGAALMVVFTAVLWRAAMSGIVVSEHGIRVRNVFSSSHYGWGEIERFEIDASSGMFPSVCRIHTRDGRMKRAFGIQETNADLRLPLERRPAAKLVGELNELLQARRPTTSA